MKSRSGKRNAKNARGLPAATAPFPKSRASYFRFARFNTSALYYTILYESLAKARSKDDTVPSLFQQAMFKADRGE